MIACSTNHWNSMVRNAGRVGGTFSNWFLAAHYGKPEQEVSYEDAGFVMLALMHDGPEDLTQKWQRILSEIQYENIRCSCVQDSKTV